MTTITLPADIEQRLKNETQRRGTSAEPLALDGLRSLFPPSQENGRPIDAKNLLDFLGDFVGSVNGSGDAFSESCGERASNHLVAEQGRALA